MATTRFLLGRRGRHLYPLRQQPTGASSSNTTMSTFARSSGTTNRNNSPTPLGRHGVPPTKSRSWNCKRQPAYAYGFVIPSPYNNNSARSWISSPVVLVTLILLSGCFIGAYCLVLRIDKTLPQPTTTTAVTGSTSSYAQAVIAATAEAVAAGSGGSTTTVTTHLRGNAPKPLSTPPPPERLEMKQPYLVPLYLNLTVFSIPCDELSVQVLQANHSGTDANVNKVNRDKLIFQNVKVDDSLLLEASKMNTARSLIVSRDLEMNESVENAASVSTNNKVVPEMMESSESSQVISDPVAVHRGRRKLEEREAEDDDNDFSQQHQQQEEEAENTLDKDGSSNQHDMEMNEDDNHNNSPLAETHHGSTNGCQVMGQLQLPLGSHHQPAIVSLKANTNSDVNLSHRVDYLRIGNTLAFPKEETMVLNKFKPHTYNEKPHQWEETVVTHRYHVNDNYHLVEDYTHDEQSSRHVPPPQSKTHEIQLVFEPTTKTTSTTLQRH